MVSRDKVIFIRQLTAIYSQRENTIKQLIRPSNNQSPIRVKSSALLLVTFYKFLSSVEMYRLIYKIYKYFVWNTEYRWRENGKNL